MKLLVINGPNLNLLGLREPEHYGRETYAQLVEKVEAYCREKGHEVSFFQSNHEGALVDVIQQAYFDKVEGIVINPAAYTHTSVALLDAVKAVSIPTVEVHISKVGGFPAGQLYPGGLHRNHHRSGHRRLSAGGGQAGGAV